MQWEIKMGKDGYQKVEVQKHIILISSVYIMLQTNAVIIINIL